MHKRGCDIHVLILNLGESLKRRNAQLTHILITGTWVSDPNGSENSQSGKRVWVVKVARREAVVSLLRFHPNPCHSRHII